MFLAEYAFYLILILVFFSVVILSFSVVSYHGVISLMGLSFFCCAVMVMMGCTYAALVMYIVYLGGLVVVFGYCVSVEKGEEGGASLGGVWYIFLFIVVGVVVWVLALVFGGGNCELLDCVERDGWVCLEVNGYSVFYHCGGVGLMVCVWGLVITLFSVLVILSWTRLGGFRPF